jgi:hypothetical protein
VTPWIAEKWKVALQDAGLFVQPSPLFMVKMAKHSGNWGNKHLRTPNYAMYVIAHKKAQGYFYNPAGMNRWVPDNTHPDHSSHVTEVPITPNVCKLKNEKGRIVRKQENSHAEVYGVLATYCPCDGGDPTIIMDPYCGTGVLCLGGIRQNVTGIYMNDQDGNCVDLARGRALEYFVGCREVGFIIPDGNGGWKAVQPTRAEIDFQAMYAIGRILQDRKAKPGNNYPLEYKRNHDGLNTRCLAANVFVAESTIKAGAKGLFAKMPFLEGTDVVPFIGKLHYDEELTKVCKHPERLWNSADESLATALEGCIYSPATFVQNGSDGKTLGTGAATFPNLKVKINENLSLSDSGRYTYVTTRPVKATEELFADTLHPFLNFARLRWTRRNVGNRPASAVEFRTMTTLMTMTKCPLQE